MIKTFPFVENTGLKTVVPENDAPFFFFKLLVSDEFLSELVQRSNDYALQVINSSRPLRRKSVLNKWKEVTLLEMKIFFGLVFHMGLVGMPSYRAYWLRSRLYKNDMFPSVMSRERFQSIMQFLHFGDEPQQPDDRLAKVRFLINHLNNNMPEIYTPHKELSLDESMMLWSGRLVFRQYIKRHKYGVKFFELCTDDGLVMKVQIYSGTKLTDTESLGQTGSIVLHLMEPYLDKGYHLFTDNWYNSVSLTEYMSKRNTYITGTLRADRKRNPSDVMRKKLQKGEMAFMFLDDISVTKWRDKRDVHVISNAHVPTMIDSVNRRCKSKRKPNAVDIYNAHMSGIDRSDQMLSYHSTLWKAIRWYKKVGIHIMEILLSIAYYMYSKDTTRPTAKNMKGFRVSIVTNLIGPPPPYRHLKPQASFHHLSTIPPTEKKKNAARACKHCYKNQKRRETRYECLFCPHKPALCVDPCFRLFHQNLGVFPEENLSSAKDE